MTANLHVVRNAWRSRPLQLCPKLTVMDGRFGVERQYVEARREIVDGLQVVGAAC